MGLLQAVRAGTPARHSLQTVAVLYGYAGVVQMCENSTYQKVAEAEGPYGLARNSG